MTIRDAIDRERRHLLGAFTVASVAAAVAVTLLLAAAGAAILGDTRWLSLPRGMPFVIWTLAIGANAAVFAAAVRRARGTTVSRIAERVEAEQALRAGAVRGALEVGDRGALGQRAAAAVAEDLRRRGAVLAPRLRRRARTRARIAAGVAAGALAVSIAVVPVFGDGMRALLHPASAYAGTLLPAMAFRDAPSAVLRGEPLRLGVAASGREWVTVHVRTPGSPWRAVRARVHDGVASLELGAIEHTTQLVADDGRARTDTLTIAAVDRPFVGGVRIRATYPAYLRRAAEELPAGGQVQVPRGTVLGVAGRASVALRRVGLASGEDTIALTPGGYTFAGRFTATESAAWQWIADAGVARYTVDVPEPLVLEVMPDSAPVADIMTPLADTIVAPGQEVGLRIGAADDHGVASVQLEVAVERDGRREQPRRAVVAGGSGTSWEGTASVTTSGAEPGDVLHVRALAVDGSPWSQTGASRVLRIRVLTAEESRARARDLADSAVAAVEATARAQRNLLQRTEDAARARAREAQANADAQGAGAGAAALSRDAAERARTIAQEQRQLAERIEGLQQAAKQLERGLTEAGAMDSALARQLRDVQELMRQALSPELMAKMQQLERAAQNLSGEGAQQALRDLAEMQRRLREQLEQSAEMLKRAAHEGAMETLGDEARDIAERQRALADSARRGESDAAKPADALADRSERFAEDVQQLQERLARDRAVAGSRGTTTARDAARRAEEALRAGLERQRPGTGPQQQIAQGAASAASHMDRAADAMQEARAAQVDQWKQELTQELDRAVQEMLQLAREERALEQQARSGTQGGERMQGRQSAVQQGVDQARQRLQEAGRRSALLSGGAQRAVADARERVAAATRELSRTGDGEAGLQAADALAQASDALNRAAASLARDRQRAGSASSASGFAEMMQQLQEMAQRQGSVNAQAQGILQMPGGQQSPQGMQMSRALARQQRQIAQGLDDIGEEAGGGRSAELAREAQALAEALEGGRLDARTAARQEQLFRRLLDAGRSLEKEEREDSDRREARAATGAETHAPGNATASGRDARRFREPNWEELRGLSAEERRAILEYFKRINTP